MQAAIEPGNISGAVKSPPSKSITQRAFAAALLHCGSTIIHNAGQSDDELAALRIIQRLGAKIIMQGKDMIEITSNGIGHVSAEINCGESGLCARLFTPIAAMSGEAVTITGTGSLLRRPMHGFREVFPLLSVTLEGVSEYLPLTVHGPLQAKHIKMSAANGSQFLSGLLFACSSCAKAPVVIEVSGLTSKPYIDLTLDVLKHFGRPVTHNNYREFYIDPTLFSYPDTVTINIEADWSSAAYLLVAGAIAGSITIENPDIHSTQADSAILAALECAGANVITDNNSITVKKTRLQAFEFDATDCPDLFPALAVLAACCDGESEIRGIHRLFNKESNRAESISEMLENFGVPFSLEDDSLYITGVRKLQGTVIDSYHDHRIVMAAAIGALRASGRVDIIHAGSVNKSYPDFFKDLISCGVDCKLLYT